MTLTPFTPLFVRRYSGWAAEFIGLTYRVDPVRAVQLQLAERDPRYLEAWEQEDDVDLHIAFKIAATLREFWEWPNDYLIPDDPFELLAPVKPGFIDDLSSAEALILIERALGIGPLPDAFWNTAFKRRFVDVVRSLEAEMAARGVSRR